MEKGKSHSPPDDSNSNEYAERLAENVEGFKQCIEVMFEEIETDEKFDTITAESYEEKKCYMKAHLLELSSIHNSLADQHARLIDKVSKNYPSLLQNQHLGSSGLTYSQAIQMQAPIITSGFDAFWHPSGSDFELSSLEAPMPSVNKPPVPSVSDDFKVHIITEPGCGGFYLYKGEGPSDFGSEPFVSSVNKPPAPPVSDVALEVNETKDPDSESSVSSVNKPEVPPDDALEVKETKDSDADSSMSSVNKPEVPPDDPLKVEKSKDSGSQSSISSVNEPEVPPDDALKVEETGDYGSESSIPSANEPEVPPDDALKVEETKDSEKECSMSCANKPAVPLVNDDALKTEETKGSGSEHKVLLGKISDLEEEVVSLKQNIQSLAEENNELNLEIDEIVADVRLYMSGTKLEMETKEEELESIKELAIMLDEQTSTVLEQKRTNQSKHFSKVNELKMEMKQYMTEISQLKSTHENQEKAWNGVIGQLKNDDEEKRVLVDKLSKSLNEKDDQLEILRNEQRSQDVLIEELKTELNSVKSKNLGVLSSFDSVQKLTDEFKLTMKELDSVLDKHQ
ncbi:hypothetical protein QVD17_35776 [Tagetes erecta]|uniref:NAB domain-containing protein n=1 Tax=Tagetes erecta TaxID=13708 RepID=A0AAD8JR41_TARER|nr:hypothetical protein QVD17_35776 [Tagetes erecta]